MRETGVEAHDTQRTRLRQIPPFPILGRHDIAGRRGVPDIGRIKASDAIGHTATVAANERRPRPCSGREMTQPLAKPLAGWTDRLLTALAPDKKPRLSGAFLKRMMGLEPTTFCMASRRSSQLSYIRVGRTL